MHILTRIQLQAIDTLCLVFIFRTLLLINDAQRARLVMIQDIQRQASTGEFAEMVMDNNYENSLYTG
jgi:hypothetical protein